MLGKPFEHNWLHWDSFCDVTSILRPQPHQTLQILFVFIRVKIRENSLEK